MGVVACACSSSYLKNLRLEDHLRPGVQDQPGQHSETLFLKRRGEEKREERYRDP
jgi:hypothetical protein